MADNFYSLYNSMDYTKLEKFFSRFSKEIVSLNLNMKQKDELIKLSSEMLMTMSEFGDKLVEDKMSAEKVFKSTFKFSIDKLNGINSQLKRNKIMKSSESYVEPVEMSSGFKYINVIDKVSGKMVRKTKQCTFQFIPPRKTLTSLFSNEEIEKIYVQYNQYHQCKEGSYERFCCGSVFQNNAFFTENPMAIQVKIFVDDFEPCNALKSKAGMHKITAFYGQINNFPSEFSSKLDHIFLIALCDASDSKSELTDTNNVIETIKNDLKLLESDGIETCSGRKIKGTLMSAIFDNLGGNVLLGLNSSFNSNYYCRICETPKSECQRMSKEDPSKKRTIESYNRSLANLSIQPNSETFGVKVPCKLNDLRFFHTMENIVVDPMHDILEGAIPFLLERIFEYCNNQGIASTDKIQSLVECFDYGNLNKANVPSKVRTEKKNMGQNASQSYCLMTHLPFILFKFKEKLLDVWKPVESLLRILQIIKSVQISEPDLEDLEEHIETHMESIMQIFKTHLRPKHHLITHYVSVIRSMGPAISLWVMRMEAKHQYFKRLAQNTKNFMNLKKTLAVKHQEMIFHEGFPHSNVITMSTNSIPLSSWSLYEDYAEILDKELSITDFENASIINSVQIQNVKYKPKYLIEFNSTFYQIDFIVNRADRFWFLFSKNYRVREYDSFLNSLLVEKFDGLFILEQSELINREVYEMKSLKDKAYIIAENLKLFKIKI